jgi:hypothetical protein
MAAISNNENGIPAAAERTALIQFLQAKGFTGPELATIIRAGRSRKQMRDDLIVKLRGLKKAKP